MFRHSQTSSRKQPKQKKGILPDSQSQVKFSHPPALSRSGGAHPKRSKAGCLLSSAPRFWFMFFLIAETAD